MGDQWSEIEERQQQMQDGSRRLLVLGAIAAGAFFAGTHFFGKPKEDAAPVGALEATIVQGSVIEVPQVIESTRPTYQAPASAPGRQTYVGVYECVVNAQRVVSDRPCGAETQTRTLAVDQPDPVEAARQRQRTWAVQQGGTGASASYSPGSGSESATRAQSSSNQSECGSIEHQIEAIDARMRQGYTSEEGERYRARLRALKESRYEYGCVGGR